MLHKLNSKGCSNKEIEIEIGSQSSHLEYKEYINRSVKYTIELNLSRL